MSEKTRYCPSCGAACVSEARFCSECGKMLGSDAPPVPPQPESIPTERVVPAFERGSERGYAQHMRPEERFFATTVGGIFRGMLMFFGGCVVLPIVLLVVLWLGSAFLRGLLGI